MINRFLSPFNFSHIDIVPLTTFSLWRSFAPRPRRPLVHALGNKCRHPGALFRINDLLILHSPLPFRRKMDAVLSISCRSTELARREGFDTVKFISSPERYVLKIEQFCECPAAFGAHFHLAALRARSTFAFWARLPPEHKVTVKTFVFVGNSSAKAEVFRSLTRTRSADATSASLFHRINSNSQFLFLLIRFRAKVSVRYG